jgi:SpoVK/Ycf46/Vps4 family AAA+-type ATPase
MIDTKRLGPALLRELQRRSVTKDADTPKLLEQLEDGSGAHLFVGERNGEVSLLVPIEDGFEGPKTVKVTLAGQENVVLDVAKRHGTVEIEGVSFARFVLEPLKYGGQVGADPSATARPQVQLRGEGKDGLWSPMGFDAWFMADFNTLKWLSTSDAMVLAPEVQPDPRDKQWKALSDPQRTALETILQRPVAAVVHDSELHEALKKVKDDGGVVAGALQSLALSVTPGAAAPKPDEKTRRAVDAAVATLDKDAAKDALLDEVRSAKRETDQAKAIIDELKKTQEKLLAGEVKFQGAVDNAELVAAKRQLQVVSLAPAAWPKPAQSSPSDVVSDAALWLADLQSRGSSKTVAALTRALEHGATPTAVSAADKKQGLENSFAFADGSTLHVGKDRDGAPAIFVRAEDGRDVVPDLAARSPFTLPLTNDAGPTAALLDEQRLAGPAGKATLLQLGFVAISERYFLHRDGSWAVIAPDVDAKGNRNGADTSKSTGVRVAAGHGPRRYDLKAPATSRANALAALPDFAQQMLRLHPPAEQQDLQVMARQLAGLDVGMLRALANAGYHIDVTRHRVSNAQADLASETVVDDNGRHLVDTADVVHRVDANGERSIVARTSRVDGALRLDTASLLGAIGYAYDGVLPLRTSATTATASSAAQAAVGRTLGKRDPLHVEQDYVDAFTAEHTRLPKNDHTQPRFFARTFALFMLDPVRCKREFPLAFAAHSSRFDALRPDGTGLRDLNRSAERPAIVNVDKGDLRQYAQQVGGLNKALSEAGHSQKPVVFTVEGNADWGLEDYVRDASRQLRDAAGREAGVTQRDEAFIPLSPADFNDPDGLRTLLTSLETAGRPALLFVTDASQLQKNSPGFAVLQSFITNGRPVPPLVLAGAADTLQNLDGALPSAMRMHASLQPLTAAHQAALVERLGQQADYTFAPDAAAALEAVCSGGGQQQAQTLWRAIATAQFSRVSQSSLSSTDTPLREITLADVRAAKVPKTTSPQERLARMVGQAEAKRQIDAIAKSAQINAARSRQGVPTSTSRVNLLFSGAPGTGKTTYAEILGDLLREVGAVKNPVVTKVTIQDLLTGSPEAAIKNLFETNKGGVIFLDEMHQLKDTDEGRRAFRAMIPMLTDARFNDTVFIGAGYSDELGDLMRNVDPGAERRFQTVSFLDYKPEGLGAILDIKVQEQHLTMDAPTRKAALSFLEHRRRTTKNFGNAGEIDVALGHARRAMDSRLSQKDPASLSAKVLMALKPADFDIPPPITKADFWAEVDALTGLDDIKAELRRMGAAIEAEVKAGGAPTNVVEPYWILDGPPGTGKTTLANVLAKFGAAYGLTAMPEVVDVQGANLQGQYVGQTAGAVQKQFEKAWGRLLFIDEVSGLARSGGAFKDEAAKMMLAQMENHRGKFMMVVADYAPNINAFLQLDPGLARRFGKRFSLPAWTPAQATHDLRQKLAADGIDVAALGPAIEKHFKVLVAQPGFASGGDVRTLKMAIVAGVRADPKALLKGVVADAFAALIDKKKKDAAA